ncbi:Eukaryotic translation initiation factor 3 subunit B [Blattella germanica]|nr:Eukaryotic translation initiation factor 3 subunit B [Blattella germanica]
MAKKKDSDKASQNSEGNKHDKNETNDEDPNFSDPEEFSENISDEELLGDLMKQKPHETDGVESVIVVDGVPQVGPERLEKLTSVVNKIFSKFGTIINEYYPTNENGHTKGYIFLEFSNPKHAQEAVKVTNNHKLDRQHTFLVNLFTDFKKYEEVPDKWEPPEPQPYVEQGNLHYYMLDPDAYDQYCIVANGGNNVQIWQNSTPDPTKLEERARWSETYVRWSPLGSYLATFHKKGVALWGGPNFSQKMRFSHTGVQFIDFSPCEKYLVTYSPHADDNPSDMKRLIIWDIRTGIEKRNFSTDGPSIWPIFRWSQDDKFFARIGSDILSVYETPSFGLLEKKSIKIPGIRDFSWSPTDNVLAYWVAEDKDVPARVTLLEIPSRNEIRAKNLFNVADCKMHWQKSGDYLCVNVNRYSKIIRREKNEVKYSGMYFNFEIFHMREKQIPVDSVEIKEVIHAFAWEPIGSKFAIIHGDGPNISVSFYGVKTGQTPSLLNVEWDPTGRYIVTVVSFWKTKVDTGFWIWSFQGKILKRMNIDMFCGLQWRPRLPTLLTAKQQQEIRKNLKKYSAQFESKDRIRLSKASKWFAEKTRRLALRNNIDTDELDSDTRNVEEEVVEFFIKEETTVID